MKVINKIIVLLLLFVVENCAPKKLQKTNIGADLYDFKKYNNLDDYTKHYRTHINHFRPNLTNIEIDRLAPFTMINSDISCIKRKGFVLVHGLSDSPFSMDDLSRSIIEHDQCAIINMPILPGHVLVPGASLEATYKDWISAVNLAVNDLKKRQVDSISIIGFSTGGALALNNILTNKDDVSKIVLISPALDLNIRWYGSLLLKVWNFIGNINNNLAYLSKQSYTAPYKYDSFSVNGTSELSDLINENNVILEKIDKIETPIFFIISMEDATINANNTLKILKNKKFTNFAKGIVYTSNKINIEDNLLEIISQDLVHKIVDLSHISLPNSPKNNVFGKEVPINYGCSHYENNSEELFAQCKTFDKDFYFGEINKANLKKYPKLSRIYYNPDYDNFVNNIISFLYK